MLLELKRLLMLAKTKTCATQGIAGHIIEVEVDVTANMPEAFNIVGLPEKAIQESRERVRSAIMNSGMEFPEQRITVSLAPADIRKTGTYYDLPVAISILAASGQLSASDIAQKLFLGELALDGAVRATHGILPMVSLGKRAGYQTIFVPKDNIEEASLVSGIDIFPVQNLTEIATHLQGKGEPIKKADTQDVSALVAKATHKAETTDMADIRGHDAIKQALCIAAAGGHNVLLSGPPGTGKTLLARAMAGILPPMTETEVLEVISIYSISGMLTADKEFMFKRPFRAPHYTISDVAMVGGGNPPKPGEITLANRGVLFLDEFPEFDRRALEALRQPMEDRGVTITRTQGSVNFPANFTLVAAMNPCPCGFYQEAQRTGDEPDNQKCTCSAGVIERYQRRISGPLLSRIDIFLSVQRLSYDKLDAPPEAEKDSQYYRNKVVQARELQKTRFAGSDLFANSDMGPRQIWEYCRLEADAENILKSMADKFQMSARSIHRTLKLARTIADMNGNQNITPAELTEALGYRTETQDSDRI